MELKIGIQHVAREIVLESASSADEVERKVTDAVAQADERGLIKLTDDKGRRVLIPSDRLAYIEIGEESGRKVGFGA